MPYSFLPLSAYTAIIPAMKKETNPPRSSTATLIGALRILARDIQSCDGIANACIAEAADRLEELDLTIKDALLHLSANIDADGNSMDDSDAATALRKALLS